MVGGLVVEASLEMMHPVGLHVLGPAMHQMPALHLAWLHLGGLRLLQLLLVVMVTAWPWLRPVAALLILLGVQLGALGSLSLCHHRHGRMGF